MRSGIRQIVLRGSTRPGLSRLITGVLGFVSALTLAGMFPRVIEATEVPFTGQVADTGVIPSSVVSIDLDFDGDLDLVVSRSSYEAVGWLENTVGDGSVWTWHRVYATGYGAQSVAVADLDDDGDSDLVAALANSDSVRWHKNLGGTPPSFDPTPIVLTTGADGAWSVATGDLDADGDIDVASCSLYDDEVAWYENDGGSAPSFNKHILLHDAPHPAPDMADRPTRVAIADINGDGALDILWSSRDDDRIGWLANSGGPSPSFTPLIVTEGYAEEPRDVTAADIDGDGDTDLVACGYLNDTLWWFRNDNGLGTIWTSLAITVAADGAFAVTTADLDADGDLDIVAASSEDDVLAWHENKTREGLAWSPHEITSTADLVRVVAVGDLDNDGDLDLAAADALDDEIEWFRNETIHRSALVGTRHVVSTVSGSGPNDLEVGDLDLDGDPDLVVSSFWDRTVRWYDNDLSGSSSFVTRDLYTAAVNRYTEAVTLADLDHDGDLDAVSAYNDLLPGATSDAIYWHESDGGSPPSFTVHCVTTIADGPVSLDTGDLDSDGDLDVVSGSMNDDTLRWYRNSGASPPTFSPLTMFTGVEDPMTLWAEDLHHHGEIDILTATRGDDIVFWLWNDSATTPSFWAYDATYVADGPRAVCAADVDRDGTIDAVVAGENNDGLWWLSNAFTGLWPAYPITGTLGGASAVAARDLDRDGDVDIVAAAYDDDEIVWFNNGGSTPWDWTERIISTAHSGPRSVAMSDLDRDGDVDVAAVSFSDNEVAWFENRGGQAAISTEPTVAGAITPGALVDVLRIVVSHRGRVGDSPVEFSRLGLHLETAPGVPMTAAEAGGLLDGIALCEDADHSGTFNPGPDVCFFVYLSMLLSDGSLALNLPDGQARLRIDYGTPRTYFVVLEVSDTPEVAGVDELRITHRCDRDNGPGVSQVEDRNHDIVLDLEPAADIDSGWISVGLFIDGFESGGTGAWSSTVGG